MESIACVPKRMIFARLDEGDDLLLSLKQCAVKHDIKSGWFNLIGGLKELAYGLFEKGEHKRIHKKASHCFEILPTFGNITQKDGDTFIHAHITAADEKEGAVCGGHLTEGCKVYPFAEVVICEINQIIGRSYDEKTNLWPVKF